MEKEARINSLFGETIFHTHINIDNTTYLKHIESFVKEKPGRTAATTDVKGNTEFTDLEEAKDNLHIDKNYKKLFSYIFDDIKSFFKTKGYSEKKFNAHITKSWATYTIKNQHIASHKHTASHFSFVYYVRNEEMGNIRFEKELAAQTGLFIPPTDEYIVNWNQFNFSSYIIPVKTGDFLIFPSGLLHYTEINTKEEPRISISGDILLTMKPGIKTEHCIPHPKGWKTI
mgnify:FL=1|tara:strand:- start:3 stop:689 length:687 start_codon:yes stop_codon:yes gene_type:complete